MKLVSLETAKIAKQLGFNEPCMNIYSHNGELYGGRITAYAEYSNSQLDGFKDGEISAPYQYQLMDWLRDSYGLLIMLFSKSRESWMFRIVKPHQSIDEGLCGEDYDNYNDALESALLEACNLIKQ